MSKMNILKSVVIVSLLFGSITSNASVLIDGIYYKIFSGGVNAYPHAEVTCKEGSGSYVKNDYTGDVTIPSEVEYNGKIYVVTVICPDAFRNSNGLTNVSIPNTVKEIGEYAFYNCRELNSLTIPYAVESIGSSAFYYCENLSDVTCLAITPPAISYSTLYPAYYMATLHVPQKSFETYKATANWNNFLTVVGDASNSSGSSNTTNNSKCDTNGDGEINIADVNTVINAILGGN